MRSGRFGESCAARRRLMTAWVLSRDTRVERPSVVCLAVKPVGEPDAGNPHVRFDERGGKTELRRGLRHQQLAKAAGNSYSPSPKRNRVSPRLYQSSRFLARRFTAAFGDKAAGNWSPCFRLVLTQSGHFEDVQSIRKPDSRGEGSLQFRKWVQLASSVRVWAGCRVSPRRFFRRT